MNRVVAPFGAFVGAALLTACSNCCPSPCPAPCPSPCAPYGARAYPYAGGGAYSTPPAYSSPAPPAYGQPGAAAPGPAQPYPGPAPAAPQAGDVVTVQGHAYTPATLMVKAGTTVRWINRDPEAHSATGNGFDVELPPGGEGSHAFTAPGTYEVKCRYHPNMRGRVIVQ